MNNNLIKIIGVAATIIGMGATILSDWANEQKMNERIKKEVNDALREAENGTES